MYADSCEEVLQTEYLLGEILKRIKGSKDFLRASHVSSLWRKTARISTVVSGFTSRNTICFIGFILEHSRPMAPDIRLITPPITSDEDPAIEVRKRFVLDVFHGKDIMGTYGGRAIVRLGSGSREGMLYTNCPYSSRPWLFKKVGRPIVPLGKNSLENRYGRFAVLEPTDGPSSGYPVFFVKDYSRDYRANHLGVYFEAAGSVRIHICVYRKKVWVLHAFGLFTPPSPCMFQRTLYCVQSGCRLYLMYLVGLIVCFGVKTKSFEVVLLPGEMGTTVKGCLQYTSGSHLEGELAIVHLEKGRLVRWVLTRNGVIVDWKKEATIDLVAALGDYMNENILDTFSSEPSQWCSFQLWSVSPGGRYVLISAGVIYGLFVVDMVYETAAAYPSPEKMGRVFPLSEYWSAKA